MVVTLPLDVWARVFPYQSGVYEELVAVQLVRVPTLLEQGVIAPNLRCVMARAHAKVARWRSSFKDDTPSTRCMQFQSKWLRLHESLPHVFRLALVDAIVFPSEARDDAGHLLDLMQHPRLVVSPSPYFEDTIVLVATVTATQGNLPLLEALTTSYPFLPRTCWIMDNAAAQGHLHILEYLDLRSISFSSSTNAMDLAARHGHLDVVRWLHSRRQPKWCNALAWAAWKGHDSIVRYLHAHGMFDPLDGGRAVLLAVQANRLSMVQWLARHAFECNVDALEMAAQRGFLDLLAWMVQSFPDKSTVKLMYHAAIRHDADMVRMLHKTDPTYTADVLAWARQRGHRKVADYVETVLHPGEADRRDDDLSTPEDFDAI